MASYFLFYAYFSPNICLASPFLLAVTMLVVVAGFPLLGPGWETDVIFDFVVLPAKGWEESSSSKNLVKSEKERVNDFVLLAKNQRAVYEELETLGVGL